jgi:hypothetical protein
MARSVNLSRYVSQTYDVCRDTQLRVDKSHRATLLSEFVAGAAGGECLAVTSIDDRTETLPSRQGAASHFASAPLDFIKSNQQIKGITAVNSFLSVFRSTRNNGGVSDLHAQHD